MNLPSIKAAFLISPPVGAASYLVYEEGFKGLLLIVAAAPIAYILAAIIGAPAYFLLKRFNWLNLLSILAVSFCISALPWALLSMSPADYSVLGQDVMVINGQYTEIGMQYRCRFILEMGTFGAISGLLFWFIGVRKPSFNKGSHAD